ncbi:MAG: NADH-quinone oxidoreductase subunit C, partial [Deltaproteobacteria bacterium]
MSMLKEALVEALGKEAQQCAGSYPASVICCRVPVARFAEAAAILKNAYGLLAAEWVADETPFGRGFGIYACYRWGAEYLIVKAEAPAEDPAFPSLTKVFVPAYRFERQIESLMGVVPVDHPDMRPWIKFEDWPADAWPLRKTFDTATVLPHLNGEYRWARAEGEGVYEIPVGPVHAGIIEPGHFRFQAVGETILNLEERLGYV